MTIDASMIACREVVELVTELLGDGLAPEKRIAVEQHLLVCPPCTSHVAQMRATIAAAASLRATPSAPSATALDVFRQWKKARGGP